MIVDTATSAESTEDVTKPQVPPRANEEKDGRLLSTSYDSEGKILTRALRSHQLWLTLTYFGLLVLMARGIAS